MPFRCDPDTLRRLEWERLIEHLARHAATARGEAACRGDLFEADASGVESRLGETDEARGLLDSGDDPPFSGVCDIRGTVSATARGSAATGEDLARVMLTLGGARAVRSLLLARRERAPRLAGVAEEIPDLRALEERLERCLTPEGELRDGASPVLRRARRRVRDLEREVQRRIEDRLRDPDVLPCLQDRYTSFREGRPVLPVRAELRGRVRGIVHDVSSSGTTVFVEPEELVEVGNRLRMARTELEGEIERILRELSTAVGASRDELDAAGDCLVRLDLALARGRLSRALDAVAPETGEGRAFALRLLRHPLLPLEGGLGPGQIVPNDVTLPEGVRALVLSGPNAGGKTIAAKAVALAALSVRAGLHVPCAPSSSLPLFDAVFADVGDEQDLRAGLSTFSARMTNLARILDAAGPRTLVLLDEVGDGTEPGEGAALAQAVMESLVDRGALVLATTHFNRLKELAGADPRFLNASAEFDRESLLPTYRIHLGVPGSSGACWVAERTGVPEDVTERARALLDHEDRRLEALTRTLSELRQELEAERRLASRSREESESVRAEYEERLAALRRTREQVLASMNADVEAAFRSARSEIASVVRALQRGEGHPGRAANRARDALVRIRRRTRAARERAAPPRPVPAKPDVQWEEVAPGAVLEVSGIRESAVLLEGPDRRGRVTVRIGSARTSVPVDRIVSVRAPASRSAAEHAVEVSRSPESESVTQRCDLRGLRVDEALERAESHLQRALGTSRESIVFIHGHGTGALREAVRGWLRELPYVTFEPGAREEGGEGVTVVKLGG